MQRGEVVAVLTASEGNGRTDGADGVLRHRSEGETSCGEELYAKVWKQQYINLKNSKDMHVVGCRVVGAENQKDI